MPQRAAKRMIWSCGLTLIAACSPGSDHQLSGTADQGGTLFVSWRAPTTNTDGSPLTNLAGYTIYYGTKPGAYTQKLTVDDPSATHAVVRGLQPGVRYFIAMSANNTTGAHSALYTGARDQAGAK